METITIIRYTDQKEGVMGAWKYWHLIQFKENGYKYDLNATNECTMQLFEIFKKAGYFVQCESK
jgi:hypothetical protein